MKKLAEEQKLYLIIAWIRIIFMEQIINSVIIYLNEIYLI